MAIWGYARVSTDDQVCDLQIDALADAGVPADRIVTEVASGAGDRPRLADLMAKLAPGDTLYIWKVDRVGRRAGEAITNLQSLTDRGVHVIVTTLGVDLTTPAGKLIFGVLAQVAGFERDTLVERTVAGLAAARRRGQRLGRRPTLDGVQAEEARRLVADEGWSYGRAARLLGVSKSVVWRAVNSGGGS